MIYNGDLLLSPSLPDRLQAKLSSLEKHQQSLAKESSSAQSPINLTYVKNVLLRFIETKDKHQKQVMINALLAALNAVNNEAH